MENSTNTKPSFKAVLLTPASRVMVKNNEAKSQYVLHNAEVTEGPGKGMVVTASFTLKNAKGETKQPFAKGDEVILYADIVNDKAFFEVGAPIVETTSNDLLVGLIQQAEVGQSIG